MNDGAGRAMRLPMFDAPEGWADDDHAEALEAYLKSPPEGWPIPAVGAARDFFEQAFAPVAPVPAAALLTGYYEPELEGALARSDRFAVPLHASPPGWSEGRPWHSRAEIMAGDLLAGHEIVWLETPIEAFLAQVQGSVRVRLAKGGTLRLGFAGKNGHPYRSIGAELVRRGAVSQDAISAQAIRAWCRDNPGGVTGLLSHNPSYVFFRQLDLPDAAGPVGAAGCALYPLRSLAVDPAHIPLGAPVWVESHGTERLRRLMIAQDTGSAIKGPGRGDVFFGSGSGAGERAGRMREPGRLTVLLPRKGMPG